jgi:hypothetical protein
MDWFYNDKNGVVIQLPGVTITALLAIHRGWHGAFQTKQQAIDYYNRNKAAHPNWHPPQDQEGAITEALPGNVDPFGAVTDAASGIKTALGIFTNKNLWIRIAEFAVGAILLAIGANALISQSTGVNPAGTGARIGKTVATKGLL